MLTPRLALWLVSSFAALAGFAACGDDFQEHDVDKVGADLRRGKSRDAGGADASTSDAADASSPFTDAGASSGGGTCELTAITAPPASLKLSTFYTRYLDAAGIPVVSSEAPDPRALVRACEIVKKLVEYRDDVRVQIIAHAGRVAVMGRYEVTTDIPEHADLYTAYPGTDWNKYRGLGGTTTRPATSCAEENLLCLTGDPYKGENILVHEFGHGMMNLGIAFASSTFPSRLKAAYAAAISAGLWQSTYAATNWEEYWAEGVQDWFDTNLQASPANGIHNYVNTRDELNAYDPSLYALIQEIYTAERWTPVCP